MKRILQVEELALFAACLYLWPTFNLSWWLFAALILTPDIGMLGYLGGTRIGAWVYNIFHHRGIALAVVLTGHLAGNLPILVAGYILFTHATLDRMLGYGLKYEAGFKVTHLDAIN